MATTTTKDVSFSIDLDALNTQLDAQKNLESVPEKSLSVKSTVFTVGSDPRVGTKPKISTPNLQNLEILKDRMNNPYVRLHWRILRTDIDSGGIVGFNVYRRDLSEEDSVSFNGIVDLDRVGFDKLSKGNKKKGKFSADKKALYNIKRKSIPLSILNPNLANLQANQNSMIFQNTTPDSPSFTQGSFTKFKKTFNKIAYVDYTQFAASEKNKFLTITDKNFVDLVFDDVSIGFYETFEYYVESVSQQLGQNPRSETIVVTIENSDIVAPPQSLSAKQINETEIQLSVKVDATAHISKVFVYRKADDEVFYEYIAFANNITDTINIIDDSVKYQKTYTYRVFAQNIHGNLSEPASITVFSSVQRITPQTRSNSLKIPIISAVQDQNSDFVKIVISPNDPNIAYYELKRRDLTIHERNFAVPSKNETNYGGNGWEMDKFFVEKKIVLIDNSGLTNPLKTKTVMNEIVFVDDTVDVNHIYEYRIRGYDLFVNPSSYAFAAVHTTGKKSIRTPINLKSEILRGFPFRIKLSWDDDNLATPFSASQYLVQRRKLSENVYESFPLTMNTFIIDEVSTPDAVLFDGTPLSTNTYTSQSNTTLINENLTITDDTRRAHKLPNFLLQNDTYFYTVVAIAANGEDRSNATSEFQVSTLPDLSDVINFQAKVLNAKVSPITVRLSWMVEETKERPDYWTIEKKYDTSTDDFVMLGKAYLATEFFDRNVEPGFSYIYRIKAFDTVGRESVYFQTGLTL